MPEPSANAPASTVDPTAAHSFTDLRAALNLTVQNCCNAYNNALNTARANGVAEHELREKAVEAYRNAMPHLTSQANIRAFIACVAHGMLIEILRKTDGAKLLYAAQVALSAVPREPRPVGRPKMTRRDIDAAVDALQSCLPQN